MAKVAFENEFTYKKYLESGREQEFDELFDKAVEGIKKEFGKKYPLLIGDREIYASETLEERSPIDNSTVIGIFQKGTREHAIQAVEAARQAFVKWSSLNYKERAALFRNIAKLFQRDKFRLAAVLSYENAKTRYESIGEVDEAIDFLHYYANELEANKGYTRKTKLAESAKSVSAGFQGAPSKAEQISINMKPYGVFGVIAPFNFPISISTGMCTGALITGNTIVFKPSSTDNMTMLTGFMVCKLFREAGVPAGAFNYLTGPGSEVGDELAASKGIAGIAFTGSKQVGIALAAKAYAIGAPKVFVVEMGGKNPTIVAKSADLECAVSGIAGAAFGFAGQKCSALSRVYVHESIKEQFISRLVDKVRSLKIGDPLKKENYMGPLISESAYRRFIETVDKAKASGMLLYGGGKVAGIGGFYVEPTIVELRHDNELMHKELFLPILAIDTYRDFDDALSKSNDIEYGLTAGLYTKSAKEVREFSNAIQAGVVYINRPVSATTGAIVGAHAFVGWKRSGMTGKGTGSRFYLQQFLREQSVSVTRS